MSALKVSLPPHLREVLEPLKGLLPPELDEIVVQSLGSTEILYDTLSNVSKWAFSDEGRAILKEKELGEWFVAPVPRHVPQRLRVLSADY